MESDGVQPAQFLSLATPTKWSELQSLMAEMSSAAPYWRSQTTSGHRHPADGWDSDWDHRFRLTDYKYIEWCELFPRTNGVSLTLDDIHQVCEAIGFEFEPEPDRIRILGYRRLS